MGLASELQEAVNSLDGVPESQGEWTDEELEAFLEDHPMIAVLAAEGFGMDEIMEAMDAGLMALGEAGKGPGKSGKGGNPGNDPFATAPLHGTNSAGKGGGTRKNPRSRTGECTGCKCSDYVCTCTCNGKKRVIDMSDYGKSGRKATYMDHWRQNHGPVHPR